MTVSEIMKSLEANGSDSIKKILLKHGVKKPFFGVKVEYLKTIQKKIKKDYQLAKDLYATGNADAMYLAGLIADDKQMSMADLQAWAAQATSDNIADYTVPWVTAEGNHGYELALEWIESSIDHIASSGWYTLTNLVTLKADNELDIVNLGKLLKRVESTIHDAPNRVRSGMNLFVIAVGSYVNPLSDEAIATAKRIGQVTIIKEGTACKVPFAPDYIEKAKGKGSLGKKKKTVKC